VSERLGALALPSLDAGAGAGTFDLGVFIFTLQS